ncbi:MAG TPA: toxin TcdB middle/N-terminal domain-containing protein, partial [Candidatus Omnitrophota bacterium]|nr:toxin TcdB middle/N-terminal domain-containing protein [Candidatus Omnitrophota bacterium]
LVLPQLSGDFNGDGLADLATFSSIEGKALVALSQGETFLPKTEWITNFGVDSQIFLGDFNGDGRVDLGAYNPETDNVHVALSTGSGFADAGIWANIVSYYPVVSAGDVNGDGLSDLVMFFYNNVNYCYYQVYYSDGASFYTWNYNDQYAGALNDNFFTGDFNGDGLSDFGRFTRSTGNWEIRYNLTDSSGIPQTLLTTVSGFGQNRNFTVSDFNDDGLLDIGYYEHLTGNIIYRPSKGMSFSSTDHSLPFVFTIYDETAQVQSSDYNGDGLTDFILYTELANEQYAYSTQGKHADLLAKSKNGLGGETSFVYGSSIYYDNSYLPFNFPVITSVNVSNCLGDEYTTAYSYGQGLWEAGEREFYGFGYTKVTDPEGNYAESYFRQDNVYMRGRPDRQEQYDAQGNLYSKSTNTWETEDIYPSTTPPVKFVKLSRTDNYVYDGDSIGKRTAQQFFYEESPQFGNLTKTVQLGEVNIDTGADTGADSRRVETLYLNNTNGTNWLIGLPYDITIKNHDNETVRRSWMYYDYHSGLTDVPVKGLLTKEEKWGGVSGNPETEFTYDSYGNLLTTTDPTEKQTKITYDPDYHIFPLRTENALGHQVVNEYYGVNGVALDNGAYSGLWGQLKSTTDPNSQTGYRDYDVFGRLVASVGPLDSITYPSVVQEYTLGNPYSFIKTRQRVNHGQAATLDVVEAYDGLGRLAQTKKPSATVGQYIVSGQTEYNSQGLPEKQYVPKFTNFGFNEIDTINPETPHTTSEYDAMGRLVQSTNPDGTYASVAYDDWTVSGTDENGHMQKSYFDAYSRLVKKEEYMGADGRSPDYLQAGYSLYATTHYAYDSEGNLVETRDHYNNTTTIQYDELGRKVSMDDPDMGYWQYGYDLNGNLQWQTDAKGQTINFDYDDLNRLTNKNDSLSLNVNYAYDDPLSVNCVGRLYKSFYDLDAQTRFFYDVLGRENQSRKVIDGQEYAVARDYDALSRLTSVTYPEGMEVFYTYDAAGQIKTVSVNTSGNQIPDPPMPEEISFDAASSAQADDVSSLDFNHTVTSEDNRVLIVAFSLRNYGSSDLTPGVSSVTYGGQALTRIAQKSHTTSVYKMTSELWYVLAPASGTNTIQVNFGRIVEGITAGSVSLYGVKQQAPEAIASASNYSKNAATSLTTLSAGAWVISSLAEHYSSSTVTADAGQTEFYRQVNSGDNFGAGSYKGVPTAGNTSVGWAFNLNRYWAQVSAAFAPADGRTAWLKDPQESEEQMQLVYNGADTKTLLSKAKTVVQELGRMVLEVFLGTPVYADTVPHAFDLITFMENDPTGRVTVTADCASYTNIETRNTNAYVYTGHTTSGDFEYEFDGIMTTADTFAGEVLLWGLSNDGGETYDDWSDGLYLGLYKSGSTLYARLFKGTTYDSYSGLSMNQRYYFRVTRSGRTVSAKIYADSARTQLLDTLTRTDSNDYEYLYAFSTENGTSTTKKATGDMCHLVQMVEQQGGGLPAPVLNSATPGNGQVSLGWSQVAGATGYKVKYGTSSGIYTTTLDVGEVTTYQVSGLQNGETYYFVVVAYAGSEESGPSNELSAAPALPQTIGMITDIQ